MDNNPMKKAAQWYYSNIFRDEAITPRASQPEERLPPVLRAARSLENGLGVHWQSRESVFLKQAKLLAAYQDDYEFRDSVLRYYPTYQSLTDRELRGYFSWRTKLRKGNVQKTSLSFVFLHIYELINQIGTADPTDGCRQLIALRDTYGPLDSSILPYLNRWLADYVVYYELDASLLADTPQVRFQKNVAVLEHIPEHSADTVIRAVKALSPNWLERSKFYSAYTADCDRVIDRVLRRVWEHCDTRCKKGFAEQYFGAVREYPVRLFDTAVFCDPLKKRECEYPVETPYVYRCKNGLWTVTKRSCPTTPNKKLGNLLKTIDARMREAFSYRHPIKAELDTKWMCKIIDQEIQALLAEKKTAEAKKITLDYTQLSHIRRDAAITQEKLMVEEEWEEEDVPSPAPAAVEGCPLEETEYRLLQCLLYGRSIAWVQAEGCMLSVLLDSINDKLYDTFLDAVVDDTPAVLDDYTDELRKMVTP